MTREEAIDLLEERYMTVSMCLKSEDCTKANKALDMAIEALKQPEQKHGKWIYEDTMQGRKHKCSSCGNYDNKKTSVKGHYCWFCGAKMDL